MMMTKLKTLRLVAIPLLMWALAGVVNANGFMMGNPPTVLGVATTLAALCAWFVTGWFAGSWSKASYLRIAVIFWVIVVVGTPLAATAFDASRGGLAPPLFLLALGAPLYGLTSLLFRWSPIEWGGLTWHVMLAWHVMIGVTAFAMTLIAFFAGRRIGGPASEEVLDNPVPS